MRGKKTFFCKNVLLYTINKPPVVLKIIISYFSYILKIMSRNTFPEPNLTVLLGSKFTAINEIK